MKQLLLFVLLFSFIISAQDAGKVTDVSPDGKTIHTYIRSSQIPQVFRIPQAPFGTTPAWTAGLERQIGGLAFGDYDLDGDLDLAAGCYFSNSYPPIPEYNNMIFRNDNGLLTVNPAWFSADSRSTTDIKWADINNDGKPDLFSGNGDGGYAPSTIYLNDGTGVPTSPSFTFTGQAWTVGTAFGDINGDGLLDLAVGNQGNTSDPYKPIFYYINQGTGFTSTPTYTSNDGMITNSVAFADLDNSDLTRVQENFTIPVSGKGALHLSKTPVVKIHSVTVNGSPAGNFCWDPVGAFVSIGSSTPAGAAVVVDYTHVKKGDLGAAKWVNFASCVYLNYMGGMSGTPAWTVNNTISQKGCGWLDYDLDGFADFVIGGNGNQHVLYKNTNGTLGASPIWTSAITSNPGTQELVVNDVNNDGYPDFSTVSFSPPRVEIYLNNAGTFAQLPDWTYIGASSLNSISYGDVNGDGMLDLAVGTARTPVVVFLNQLTPVPVELSSFTADVNNGAVTLSWTTATETNNREFAIERKQERDNYWSVIGSVPGAGTSTLSVTYSFTDENTLGITGKVHYRLRQTDFDGTAHTLQPLTVEIDNPASFEVVGAYPNPVTAGSSASVRFTLPVEGKVVIEVYDATGELVLTKDHGVMAAGTHEVAAALPNSPTGVYFYSLEFGSSAGGLTRHTGKFMVTK